MSIARVKFAVPLLRHPALLLNSRMVVRSLSNPPPENQPQAPQKPVDSVDRAKWAVGEKNPSKDGKKNWILRLLGYYTQESTDIRSSIMLYTNAREQAARQEFLRQLGVENDLASRFQLECLHVWMIFVRLRREGKRGKAMSQEVFDRFWEDMTKQLVSLEVKSISLNTRTRELQNAFYGSAVAYDFSLANSDAILASALHRNLFNYNPRCRPTQLLQMVAYVRAELHRLHAMPTEEFLAGGWRFTPPLAARAPPSSA
mmetsp:Transcript_7959/g.23953  ORF Transcript_7959/g.23953 Transcript_7959/m.23953 type:complete len:258 (+) Transcript_7959:75-848(+)